MKKFASILAILLLLFTVLSFASCKKKENGSIIYNSYICDMANDGLIKEMEKDWWNGSSKNDSTAQKEKKITVQGVTYDCTYVYSEISGYSDHYVDKYEDREGNIQVSVLPSSNDVVGFHRPSLFTEEEFLSKEDVYENAESALPMAKEIASQYIDVNDYTIESSTSEFPHGGKEYVFQFTRYVGNFRTSDRLYLAITSKGDLRTLGLHNIGLFKDKQISVDEGLLNESVEKKLNKIYSEGLNLVYTHKIVKQTLAYSPENDLVVVSQIEVSVTDQYNTGVVLATVIE